ncbi:YoaK family protein [Atopobium deltae]|uniref:DUF1275 domain-containing protein n=1 Tax=Atopobium deltae TaxID=1393034 RepID=A0A133XVS7_9ACTN|nr:YoaK family protein [Atopobium deltae]KXB35030.1 hypothetical protein HMPREF3192_00644 [Atopobium deltae]
MRHAQYTAESIELAIFLALSGGLMDAYSYLMRDQVFANAQTGNLLLLGVHVASGNFSYISHYAMPVIAFALGIAFIHFISLYWVSSRVSWHTIAVAIEIALLLGVGCIPAGQSLLANSLTSLACGIQVQAFRRLHGFPFATTMCIGNLRAGMQELISYISTSDPNVLEGIFLHYGTIACFVAGAIVGSKLVPLFGIHTIWGCCALLSVGLIILLVDTRQRIENKRKKHEAEKRSLAHE